MHGQGAKEGVGVSMAPLCLFWCMWRERNKRTFDGVEFNDLKLKEYPLLGLL